MGNHRAGAMSGIRILVVDDDSSVRELVSHVLLAKGFEVFSSADAEGALAILDRERVDLVITDKRLPDMDGHALIETIFRVHPYVGTMMFTAYRSAQSLDMARQQKVLAYLEKPLRDLTVIPRLVESALEQHRKRLGRP